MRESSAPRRHRLALLAILLAAGALRFAGLTHHLARAGPEYDERTIFVEPVLRMWRTGSLDPVVYTGYAGFFNHLIALPVALGQRLGAETGAAAAARAVTAAFGVCSVALAYLLARYALGGSAALFAAALLAVSPLEVRSAHYVTPDVVVGTALLAALTVLARGQVRGRESRAEVVAGALLGAATAVKYTGLLLAPAIVADRLVRGRGRGLWRAALAAAAAFAACAPFALLQLHRQGSELAWAFQSYYGRDAAANRFAQGDASGAAAPLAIVAAALGPVGCALALAALPLARERRPLLPWLGVLTTAAVALAPANLVYPRHLVPAAVVTPLLAAAGWRALQDRLAGRPGVRPVLGLLALAALLPPAVSSARLVERYLRTPAVERAAQWIEGHVAGPALVAVSLDRFALDASRFEVRTVGASGAMAAAPAALRHYDLLVTTRREAEGWAGFTTVSSFESEEPDSGLALVVLRPAARASARLAPPTAVHASHDESRAGAAWDADPDSAWSAPAGPGWIAASWAQAVAVERIEVETGNEPEAWPQDLAILGTADGTTWGAVEVTALRPNRPARQRIGAPHGQIYVLVPPRRLRGLRIERGAGGPWTLASVRVFATDTAGTAAP